MIDKLIEHYEIVIKDAEIKASETAWEATRTYHEGRIITARNIVSDLKSLAKNLTQAAVSGSLPLEVVDLLKRLKTAINQEEFIEEIEQIIGNDH